MNNQLSREALIIYLENIRALEYIQLRCNKSIEMVNKKQEQIEREIVRMKNTEFRYPKKPSFGEKILEFLILAVITGILEIIFINLFMDLLPNINENIILTPAALVFVIEFIIILFVKYKKEKSDYIHQKNQVQNNIHQHNDNFFKTEAKLNRFKIESEKYTDEIYEYRSEINLMLYKLYRLDIVPKQFRDICGITYLYDFISTSNLSLADAVLNCNMEQIKSKLDVIISKCDEIIREVQRVNANLSEIQRQNNRLLAEARNIARNTALAAQYSEIAAMNSEVSLELQKKQFVYQKVDFWLNSI